MSCRCMKDGTRTPGVRVGDNRCHRAAKVTIDGRTLSGVTRHQACRGRRIRESRDQFVPMLRTAGVRDDTLRKILVDNPRRFLAFEPPTR